MYYLNIPSACVSECVCGCVRKQEGDWWESVGEEEQSLQDSDASDSVLVPLSGWPPSFL